MHISNGLHHLTAIASDPQRNLDFYTGVLGLRLVKLTVNFDDPSSYHLYYGDTSGAPGTILTFFSWPGAQRARVGQGAAEITHLRAPHGSLPFWFERLQGAGVAVMQPTERAVQFADFDGLKYEILEGATPAHVSPWTKVVAPEYALAGMSGVTLRVGSSAATAATLEGELGFTPRGEREWASPTGDFVRLVVDPKAPRAGMGSGGVHHVAFRAQSEAEQRDWLLDLRAAGLGASPVMDREYFRSIYFREPNGVLFEIATDAPGFAIDEPLEALGQMLQLPPQYEKHRAQIAANLPPLRLPEVAA